MPLYNKLVRDKIPEIIINSNKTPHTRILDADEYITELHKKLDEECAEFHKDKNVEELADIMEVVMRSPKLSEALRKNLNVSAKKKPTNAADLRKRYFLKGSMTDDEKNEIRKICDEKLDSYFSRDIK